MTEERPDSLPRSADYLRGSGDRTGRTDTPRHIRRSCRDSSAPLAALFTRVEFGDVATATGNVTSCHLCCSTTAPRSHTDCLGVTGL